MFDPPFDTNEYVTKDSGKKTVHSDGVQRDTRDGKTLYTLMFPKGVPLEEQLIHRVAELYTRGAKKYGDRNWENSAAQDTLEHHREALWRHFMKFFMEVKDGEDHAAAVVWNLNAIEQTKRNLALKRADESAASDDDVDEDLQKWHRESGTSDYSTGPVIPQELVDDTPKTDLTALFPKFGTPEFDARAEQVAAEQAKDWPKRENGRYSFNYEGHEFSDTGRYSTFSADAETHARAIAMFHNFLSKATLDPVDYDPNYVTNRKTLADALNIPAFPYSGTVQKDRF